MADPCHVMSKLQAMSCHVLQAEQGCEKRCSHESMKLHLTGIPTLNEKYATKLEKFYLVINYHPANIARAFKYSSFVVYLKRGFHPQTGFSLNGYCVGPFLKHGCDCTQVKPVNIIALISLNTAIFKEAVSGSDKDFQYLTPAIGFFHQL
eukprot:NP_510058.1 Uncharacterized protein CELE_F17A2.4 [Caenorhabditis elegans]